MITYQSILRNELSNRKRKNPAYSIRSLARDLGLSQSFLTQVLNKKRKLSDEKAIQISSKLKLSSFQKKLFVDLVRLDLTKDLDSQEVLKEEITELLKKHPKFTLLSEDTFNIVADWYYFGILELTTLKSFKNDSLWISRKLNVPIGNINIAIDRLKRVGLLTQDDRGRLKKVEKNYLFENVSSSAIRKHHHQTLDLAHMALEKQILQEREFFTVSMPMNTHNMVKAKKMIREFSEKLMAEMEGDEPQSIYKLAVQFFRLDKEVK